MTLNLLRPCITRLELLEDWHLSCLDFGARQNKWSTLGWRDMQQPFQDRPVGASDPALPLTLLCSQLHSTLPGSGKRAALMRLLLCACLLGGSAVLWDMIHAVQFAACQLDWTISAKVLLHTRVHLLLAKHCLPSIASICAASLSVRLRELGYDEVAKCALMFRLSGALDERRWGDTYQGAL